jgi:hypothetical protein
MFFDEALQLQKCIQEFGMPIVANKTGTLMFLAGTKSNTPDSFLTKMRDAVVDGDRYVNLLEVTRFCQMCRKHKLSSTCIHGLKWMSMDINTKLQKDIAMLYTDKSMCNVEIFGLDPEQTAHTIDPARIEKFIRHLDTEYVNMCDPNARCFIACDPNNGGANHTAFVAAIADYSKIKVLYCFY